MCNTIEYAPVNFMNTNGDEHPRVPRYMSAIVYSERVVFTPILLYCSTLPPCCSTAVSSFLLLYCSNAAVAALLLLCASVMRAQALTSSCGRTVGV